jgi:hypothetical protein
MLAARKSAFETFIQLINRAPNIVRIGPGVDRLEVWTMTGDIEAYDTRFPTIECMVDELGIKSLRSKNGEVDLWLWDDPMGFRGPSKGIAYSTKPVAPLYGSVDDPARTPPVFIAKDPDLIYARIAPNWYAFYDFAQE